MTKIKAKLKNASQVAKGVKRATNAARDEKGKFVKVNREKNPAECPAGSPAEGSVESPAGSPAGSPAENPAESPAQHPAQTSSLYITTSNLDKIGPRQDRESHKLPFEQYIKKAVEDEYWLKLMMAKTKLPLGKRKVEVMEIFKNHVVCMGKEGEITSEKKAKAYFHNFLRRGTPTYRQLVEELRRRMESRKEEDPYRYEDVDPVTGERSYYGMSIPPEAPPRPNPHAVYVNGRWAV